MKISVLVFNTSRVGFWIGIVNFALDRKFPEIPKSRRSASGYENPEKYEKSKTPKIPGFGIGIFKPRKNPSRKLENPRIPGIGKEI